MELSEAILTGCSGTYQIMGKLIHGQDGLCALGAAMRGAGMAAVMAYTQSASERFPLLRTSATCPVVGCDMHAQPEDLPEYNVIHVVPHLNDHHRWSREAIAMWVEGLERGLRPAVKESAAQPAVVAAAAPRSNAARSAQRAGV